MRIGFTGAHRTGKTTTARTLARLYRLPMVDNHVSATVKAHGFDMARDNRLDTGMTMQIDQLATLERNILAAGPRYVSDRTPLDAAMYLLGDATAGAGTTLTQEGTVEYVERAMRMTAQYFDLVILVPPAITFELVDGKPPLNPAYQEHLHQLCRGLLFDDEIQIRGGQIQRTCIDPFDRVKAVCDFIAAWKAEGRAKAA